MVLVFSREEKANPPQHSVAVKQVRSVVWSPPLFHQLLSNGFEPVSTDGKATHVKRT